MKKMHSLFAGIAVLLIALLSYLTYSNDAERAIRQQVKSIARDCEKQEGQGVIRSATRAVDLPHYFTSNATIQLGGNYPFTPSVRELPALFSRIHMATDTLKININGIDFLPRTNRYVMESRVAAEAILKRGEAEDCVVDEFLVRWKKSDGAWLIDSAHSDSTIKPVKSAAGILQD